MLAQFAVVLIVTFGTPSVTADKNPSYREVVIYKDAWGNPWTSETCDRRGRLSVDAERARIPLTSREVIVGWRCSSRRVMSE